MKIDAQTLDARVPNMILQPLVENAIIHGIAPRGEGGRIEIAAARENGWLTLRISDDGRGLAVGQECALREGVGLANTRARLEQLYGAAHRFRLGAAPAGGVSVSLAIPFQEEAPSEG